MGGGIGPAESDAAIERRHIMQMKIDGRTVDVRVRQCKDYACLIVGRYNHHSACGSSGCGSSYAGHLSCLTRDNRGCPEHPHGRQERTYHAHDCPGPRYLHTVRSGRGNARCKNCGRLVPKAAIVDPSRAWSP